MTTTQKHEAHREIKRAAWSLTSWVLALADAESDPNSTKDKEHLEAMSTALWGSAITKELPTFQPADVWWLARTVLGGMDLEGVENTMRNVALSQVEAMSAITTPAAAVSTEATQRGPVTTGYRTGLRCRTRRGIGCAESCCSCCHRHHCAPHLRH